MIKGVDSLPEATNSRRQGTYIRGYRGLSTFGNPVVPGSQSDIADFVDGKVLSWWCWWMEDRKLQWCMIGEWTLIIGPRLTLVRLGLGHSIGCAIHQRQLSWKWSRLIYEYVMAWQWLIARTPLFARNAQFRAPSDYIFLVLFSNDWFYLNGWQSCLNKCCYENNLSS
jgi:hypothetical protein